MTISEEVKIWIEQFTDSTGSSVKSYRDVEPAIVALFNNIIEINKYIPEIISYIDERKFNIGGVLLHVKYKPNTSQLLISLDEKSKKLVATPLKKDNQQKKYFPVPDLTFPLPVFYNRFSQSYESWERTDEIVPKPGELYPRKSASIVVIEQVITFLKKYSSNEP